MKDPNDQNRTIDWVDEVKLTDSERKFLEDGEEIDFSADFFVPLAPENRALSVALNMILDRTINGIINNTTEQ